MEVSTIERPVLAHVATAPMLAQVTAWSRINSGSRNLAGLAEMASVLAEALATLPGLVELRPPAPVEAVLADGSVARLEHGRNLLLAVRPKASRRVLLTGHMDTVFAETHPFQTPEMVSDGVLNGPGCADMKGGLAVMLAALTALEQEPALAERIGYDVVINADEEVGSLGSAPLLAERAAGKIAAFTFEPSLADGTLAGARPGSGNFSLVVAGRAAHAGRNPQDGRNALVAAADLALRLSAIAGPDLLVNPARIEGGAPNNIVPDHAILRINLRPSTHAEQDRAERAMTEIVRAVAARHDVSISRHGGFARPPKPLDHPTERLFALVRDCGSALGQEIGWRATGGVCDGNNIAAMGVPVVDTMGVRGGAIHTGDEFMIVDSLAERAQLAALVLMRIAAGAIA